MSLPIDTNFVNGDFNAIRDILRRLAAPPESAYNDGNARETSDFINFVYQRAATIPATPTENGIPTGWSDAPPADDGNPLWMTKSYQRSDGALIGTWSTPVQQDGESLVVQFSTNAIDWHDTYATGDIWARQKVKGGSFGSEIRVVGEGTAGVIATDHITDSTSEQDGVTTAKLADSAANIFDSDATTGNTAISTTGATYAQIRPFLSEGGVVTVVAQAVLFNNDGVNSTSIKMELIKLTTSLITQTVDLGPNETVIWSVTYIDSSPLGSEKVTNGDFSGGITGWNNSGFDTLEVTGGALHAVKTTSSGVDQAGSDDDIAVENTITYLVAFDITLTSGVKPKISLNASLGGTERVDLGTFGTGSHKVHASISVTENVVFQMEIGNGDVSEFTIDNISLKAVPVDYQIDAEDEGPGNDGEISNRFISATENKK